jgi:hypothetical protein
MSLHFQILVAVNALAFLLYGFNSLFFAPMIAEFNRFGLTSFQRKITGIMQIFGALGLLLGLRYPAWGLAASVGLCILMVLGFGVRLKIKDSFSQAAPSFIFILLNAYLVYKFLSSII